MARSSAAPKIVHAQWDDEAKVWWATSEDVSGLVAEERTYEALLKTVLELVPELLRLNGHAKSAKQARIKLIAERQEMVALAV